MAAPAAAQGSNVSVYGRINTTIEAQKSGGTYRTAMENNASRFGFTGLEDLRGGLSAFFTLEADFDSTGGPASDGFRRDTFVGLGTPWGQVRLGNITNITELASADYVSLHNHDTGTSADALYGFDVAFDAKENTVGYATPTWNGLRAEVTRQLREQEPYAATNATLSYQSGALELAAGYSRRGPDQLGAVRALYSIEPFVLGAYYERDDYDGDGRNNLRLSFMYAVGASEFHLNYGVAGDRGAVRESGAQQYTLGYNHLLSRRTKLYGYYTRLANEANASYAAFGSLAPGESQRAIALGIRHAF